MIKMMRPWVLLMTIALVCAELERRGDARRSPSPSERGDRGHLTRQSSVQQPRSPQHIATRKRTFSPTPQLQSDRGHISTASTSSPRRAAQIPRLQSPVKPTNAAKQQLQASHLGKSQSPLKLPKQQSERHKTSSVDKVHHSLQTLKLGSIIGPVEQQSSSPHRQQTGSRADLAKQVIADLSKQSIQSQAGPSSQAALRVGQAFDSPQRLHAHLQTGQQADSANQPARLTHTQQVPAEIALSRKLQRIAPEGYGEAIDQLSTSEANLYENRLQGSIGSKNG